MNTDPIAVFDSGLGGLSVVRQLRQILPAEDIVYFGDTARVPYGSKSRRTVAHFALEIARFLLQYQPKLMVAACNTVSALALDTLRDQLPVPIVGVVEPGARAAAQFSQGQPIAVLGTEATIASGAYPAAIHTFVPGLEVMPLACPLLVPLVEAEHDCDDPLVQMTLERYLAPIRDAGVRVVVLGCTHYPLLHEAISRALGPAVHLVDSGRETALTVQWLLNRLDSLCPVKRAGNMRCYVSDNPVRFRRVGSRFLHEDIGHVEFVEPERYITAPDLESESR